MPTLQATPKRRIRTVANHLMPHTKKAEPAGRMATEEEIALFREAEEEFERGEYYSMLPEETAEEFFARIDSDPEKWLECNLEKANN